MALYIDNLLS